MYLQLWHLGRHCHSSLHPNTKRIVSASAIPMGGGNKTKTLNGDYSEPETPHALTVEEIQQTIQDFATGAMQAKKAGFDGVEIHSASGYLVDLFLQSTSNERTDEYGGSMENRTRLLVEIFQAIVDSGAFPANRVGFRLSPNAAYAGMGAEDNFEMFIHVAKTMHELKPAYLHLVDGLGFGFHNKCKLVRAADIRKVFDGPIIVNASLTKEIAEGMVRSGAADMVSFARYYLANPDLVDRFKNNWPLAEVTKQEHWWGYVGAEGYTDYPAYSG
jgi:N-ethylmaleimide reductase